MNIKDAIKVFGTNIICCVLAILGGVGCYKSLNGSAVILSFNIVLVIVSIIAMFYANIKLFSKKEPLPPEEINDKAIEMQINRYVSSPVGVISNAARSMQRQLDTFDKREQVLLELLNGYFSEDENFTTYTILIEKAQRKLSANVTAALKRMSIFDQGEYNLITSGGGSYSESIRQKKLEQYNEHLTYISKVVDYNDSLIIEFDELITEVSRLNDSDEKNDLSLIQDTVNALKKLHFSEEDELSGLKEKY